MRIKKALILAILLSLFSSIFVRADLTYTVKDLNISLNLNENYIIFDRYNIEGNKNLESIGYTEEALKEYLMNNDIYLDVLLTEDYTYEFVLLADEGYDEEDFTTYSVSDFTSLTQKTYEEISAESDYTYNSYDTMYTFNEVFMVFDYYSESADTYYRQYYTIVDNKAINFLFFGYGEFFTSEISDTIYSIVSGINIPENFSLTGDIQPTTEDEEPTIEDTTQSTEAPTDKPQIDITTPTFSDDKDSKEADSEGKDKNNTLFIILIIGAVIAALVVIVLVVVIISSKKKKKAKINNIAPQPYNNYQQPMPNMQFPQYPNMQQNPNINTAVNNTPVYNNTPAFNPAPVVNNAPVVNPAPAYNPAPVVNNAPVVNPAPAYNPAPVVNNAPVVNQDTSNTSPTIPGMKICPNCKATIKSEAAFCTSCGYKQEQ